MKPIDITRCCIARATSTISVGSRMDSVGLSKLVKPALYDLRQLQCRREQLAGMSFDNFQSLTEASLRFEGAFDNLNVPEV